MSLFEKYLNIQRKENSKLLNEQDFERAFGLSYGDIGIVNTKPKNYKKDDRHLHKDKKRINTNPYWKGYKGKKLGINGKHRHNFKLERKT
jgi:hypothetical protein